MTAGVDSPEPGTVVMFFRCVSMGGAGLSNAHVMSRSRRRHSHATRPQRVR
jgi:hypothetical protein